MARKGEAPRRAGWWAATNIVGTMLSASAWSASAPHSLTARDVVELSSFSVDENTGLIEGAKFSPDRRYFVTVTTRGVVADNRNESTLWLFDANAIQAALRGASGKHDFAIPLARMVGNVGVTASGDKAVITEVRWTANGRSLAFLGRDGRATRRLFSIDVESRLLKRVSAENDDVTAYDEAGSTYLYAAAAPSKEEELYQMDVEHADGRIGTGRSLFDLLFPKWEPVLFGSAAQTLRISKGDKLSPVIERETGRPVTLYRGEPAALVLALSRTGRYGIAANTAWPVPATWVRFYTSDGAATSFFTTADDPAHVLDEWDNLRPAQYVLIDVETGAMSPLVDAPLAFGAVHSADPPLAAWSDDERYAAVSGTFLPLTAEKARSTAADAHPCIAVVEIATRHTECVSQDVSSSVASRAPKGLAEVEWQGDRNLTLVYVTASGARLRECYRRSDSGWVGVNRVARLAPANALRIRVQESLNEPPVLVARDNSTGRSIDLLDPNPQLRNFVLGAARVYRWRDHNGHEWTGGLVEPPGPVGGRRPLVIQTHGFDPTRFLVDGYYSTGTAARALAGRGIMVLQVGEIRAAPVFTPREATEDGSDGYESAIDQLDRDGLVDSRRVGIIGFSQTGWYVIDSLIHQPRTYAAATLADSVHESFGQYLSFTDFRNSSNSRVQESALGSKPFADGFKNWLVNSPGFNTEKISVPILFEENGPVTLINSWDVYSSLRQQSKPVDLLYIPYGSHILSKPRQIVMSQEMTVDWYDFWLAGHEDPAGEKGEQYRRWERFCDLQVEQNPDRPAFCVRSKPH